MRLLKNTGADRVIDLLDPKLQKDGQLDIVTPEFSLFAFSALQAKLANPKGRARLLAGSDKTPGEIVTELYLAAFTRPPTSEELAAASAGFGTEAKERQAATEDVLWALLNSPEFVFNH